MSNKDRIKNILIGATIGLVFSLAINASNDDKKQDNVIIEQNSETVFVSENEVAPDFRVTDMNGNRVNLTDFRGELVVVMFWTTQETDSVEQLYEFEKVYNEYKDDVEFMFVRFPYYYYYFLFFHYFFKVIFSLFFSLFFIMFL